MTVVIKKHEIEAALGGIDTVAAMERSFLSYCSGRAVVPPVGELLFRDPPGEVHIKYGYVTGDEYYVVKVASGFYNNPALGLPSSNGLMLLFRQQTGELLAVLLDEGRLTDIRTAAAGATAARYLAPGDLNCIGIIGCGTQAEQQLRSLASVVECRQVLVWGRDIRRRTGWIQSLAGSGFDIRGTDDLEQMIDQCRLLVTTTPSTTPLLQRVRPGTHITAIGSDTPEKQELAASVMAQADLIVVDSRAQAQTRGEVFRAQRAGVIETDNVVELGEIISGAHPGRSDDSQITVADLTGIATQDIEIAAAVYKEITNAD
jgi:ornithine cyclodeaminase/alanine dehydrogenase-like protein (mu-crystallin family)